LKIGLKNFHNAVINKLQRRKKGIFMKKIFFTLLILSAFFACQNNRETFTIKGVVENAQGKTIILEHIGLAETVALDSMVISKNGKFSFNANRPDYPDFYRLRIQNRLVFFVVDSTETITVNANFENFSTEYSIKNSPQSELIQKLRISVINIQNKVNALNEITNQDEQTAKTAEIEQMLEQHRMMARELILENPRSNVAYFALYQTINGFYIFSPFVSEDFRYWAAVATSYHAFMPNNERSQNLYDFVMEALQERRLLQQQDVWNELIETEGRDYIDIILPNRRGVEQRLSDLRGKVILIDFSAYEIAGSIDYTFALRDLHTKYNHRGFEIFQISLDRNRLFWENSVEAIPWIAVRDETGTFAQRYNISQIPTTFLMDREMNIVARDLTFGELDREIDRLLRR